MGVAALTTSLVLTIACGSEEDPYADTTADETDEDDTGEDTGSTSGADTGAMTDGDGGDATTGAETGTTGTDAETTGADADTTGGDTGIECPPTPSRMIVLGDSISACAFVCLDFDGNCHDAPACSYKMLHEHMNTNYAPGLTYENISGPGDQIDDLLAQQLDAVEVGQPGHALVVVFIGGNDLKDHIYDSEEELQTFYDGFQPYLLESWATIHDFFNDPVNFPDGVTFIMNNQYNPYDDCSEPPFSITEDKWVMLGEYNDELRGIAEARENTTIVDTFTPFRGHGFFHNNAACPFYMEGYERWTTPDIIHPNVQGHAQLFSQYSSLVDQMYGESCG